MSSSEESNPPAAAAGSSLASRITKPSVDTTTPGMNADAQTFKPSSKSWADEVNSPQSANPETVPAGLDKLTISGNNEKNDDSTTAETKQPDISQMDGATEPLNGSQLHEPDYMVELKLADMQADPNNPLYSIKTFEELGLWVTASSILMLKLTRCTQQ